MRTVILPDGNGVPALGLATWLMGESKRERATELAALHLGIALGVSLIDTEEVYGDGGTEDVVDEAIHGQRSDVFVVTKVFRQNALREKRS